MNTTSKFKAEYYVTVYRLAREGKSNEDIARVLGVTITTFNRWCRKRESLAEALAKGREELGSVESFKEFVHGRLTPAARQLWDELEAAESEMDGDSRERVDAVIGMIADQGTRLRQQLFVHALMSSNFQPTVAARRLGVPINEVTAWAKDKRFAEMIRQVHQCKKDFFEGALIELVAKGDSAAVIFVNKTINKDRGYSEKTAEDGVKRHEHIHRLVLDDLPADVKRQVLESMRRKQLEHRPTGDIIDAEVEP